jgi:hypothetical protein
MLRRTFEPLNEGDPWPRKPRERIEYVFSLPEGSEEREVADTRFRAELEVSMGVLWKTIEREYHGRVEAVARVKEEERQKHLFSENLGELSALLASTSVGRQLAAERRERKIEKLKRERVRLWMEELEKKERKEAEKRRKREEKKQHRLNNPDYTEEEKKAWDAQKVEVARFGKETVAQRKAKNRRIAAERLAEKRVS